jgi:hypothetical protein
VSDQSAIPKFTLSTERADACLRQILHLQEQSIDPKSHLSAVNLPHSHREGILNQATAVLASASGQTMPVTELAKYFGISKARVYAILK